MKVIDEKIFSCLNRKRGFSKVLERVILEKLSRGKPPDLHLSFKDVDAFISEKRISMNHLHLKNIWFIAFEKKLNSFGL